MAGDQVGEDFPRLADPFRRELLAHCYRMLGSVHDAEDLVQETYLRAWRAYEKFEGRSSLRTWLHRIATNTCLDALESRGKRPLPTGLGAPSTDPTDDLVEQHEVPWLEPMPDAMVGADGADPAAIVTSRESVRLAFIAALQHLPPRQRAVLLLCEVLKWKAVEVAELLGTSTASVNSALQRARAQIGKVSPSESAVTEPATAEQRELLDRYVTAFEKKDMKAVVGLFTEDAVWEMPPFTGWYEGPENIGTVIDLNCPAGPDELRLIPTTLNAQPAFGMYMVSEDGPFLPFNIMVLTLEDDRVSHVVAFFDRRLFETCGLPDHLPAGTGPADVRFAEQA